MNNTKLSAITRQSALLTPEKDTFWPIADQYIGLEMELERFSNRELENHRMAGSPFWIEHTDGSLRNGIEMVLSQALMGTSLREAISYFFRTFTKYSSTPRTSIHVHVNMRQENETVEGLRNMVALYYMYEDAFFLIADQNRKWCAYCNAFEDTPPAILEAVMDTDMGADELAASLGRSAGHNTNRYYGLNLNALSKFGTLEFRHFPLVTDESRLIDWLKLIMELKAAANRMADEGHTPWSVFVTPDDIAKLTEYMPLYGQLLMQYVTPSRAFHRMIIVRNLGAQRQADIRQEVLTNPAFRIFQNNQQKQGKKVAPRAPKIGGTATARTRDIAALRREIEGFARLIESGRTLTGAQIRRRQDYQMRLEGLLRLETMEAEPQMTATDTLMTWARDRVDTPTTEGTPNTPPPPIRPGQVFTADMRGATVNTFWEQVNAVPTPNRRGLLTPRTNPAAEIMNPFDEADFNERQERDEDL